ncbi:chlorhexidine efflux transporter [Fuscovulum blasticum]|uniref:chlorhexidine efflux transporter n=1 Tax=Fuscovulum blasticum TaxID=1075 RepID=UPI000D3ED9E3|nr:chlorhexidine efflux transporter [Fuscovulum blasticum]AWD22691.1 hypothetical protein B6K69_14255 [Fuscovulum blasticum]
MSLRSPRERLCQTLAYEAGGLILAVPIYLIYSGASAGEGVLVMLAVTTAVLLWCPLHNSVFDWVDLRLTGRAASDRPHRWRILHACSYELSTTIVTLPVLVWLGGLGVLEAVPLETGLTAIYAVYAYVFHLWYDRLRPVGGLGAADPAAPAPVPCYGATPAGSGMTEIDILPDPWVISLAWAR